MIEIIIATIIAMVLFLFLIIIGIEEGPEFQLLSFIAILGIGFPLLEMKEELTEKQKLETFKQANSIVCNNKLIKDFQIIDKKIIDKETNYVYRIKDCEALKNIGE